MNEEDPHGQRPPVVAAIFDVYGTLLRIDDPFMRRSIPRFLGLSPREWIALVRQHLLTTDFGTIEEFADFLCMRVDKEERMTLKRTCMEIIEKELTSVRPYPGALPLLKFLRRRGLKIGLASNLSSAHTLVLERLGLGALCDAKVLSCEDGLAKPHAGFFRLIARKLGVEPSASVVVGDSVANDIRPAAALGFSTVSVGTDGGNSRIDKATDFGLFALCRPEPLRPLLAVGSVVELPSGVCEVAQLDPVPDDLQGRHNLVWRAAIAPVGSVADSASYRVFFAKRYLYPESAYVEAFAREVMMMAGFSVPETLVVEGAEPVFLSEGVGGVPYAGETEPEIAGELASHMVFAYVFSNADIRPRNVFLDHSRGKPAVNVIDFEHCFLNRALDVSQLPERFDPRAIDNLGAVRLEELVRRQVLTDRTLRRGRGEFFDTATAPADFIDTYRRRFVETFRHFQSLGEELTKLVSDRIYSSPPLVVGTSRYRRAMAGIDLQDIRSRLAEDPRDVVDRVLGD
jgi:putative hydrolase of the HAD superfamily